MSEYTCPVRGCNGLLVISKELTQDHDKAYKYACTRKPLQHRFFTLKGKVPTTAHMLAVSRWAR